jgi:hypothetical protein
MLHDVIYFLSIRDGTFDMSIWRAGLVGEKSLKGPIPFFILGVCVYI